MVEGEVSAAGAGIRGGPEKQILIPKIKLVEEDNMPEPIIITKQMIEQTFDDSAKSYDSVGPNVFTQFGRRLVDRLPLVPGANVLDIATGKGAVLIPTAQRVGSNGHVVGIDLSRAILQETERILRESNLTNVKLRRMDAEQLEFPDQTFDFVICAFALFLFPDIKAALREMNRVCKPEGYFGFTFFGKPLFNPGIPALVQQFMLYGYELRMPQPLAYTPDEVKALLSQFDSVETYTEMNDIIYTSLEDIWSFLLTLPIRSPIMSMNEDVRTRFKNEYFAKISSIGRADGFHVTMPVIYAIAKR